MRNTSTHLVCGTLAAAAALAATGHAQAAIDGTLTAGDGYGLVSTQTNVSASASSENGGAAGPSNEATATNTLPLDQLSNAYAQITGSTLNLFFGGSIGGEGNTGNGSTDAKYFIALQTEAGGVNNLNGIFNSGGLGKVVFDSGFAPNFVLEVSPSIAPGSPTRTNLGTGTASSTNGGLSVEETDLTAANSATSAVTAVINNALQTTAVGSSASPSFAAASTGLELSIDLSTLGYTPGSSVLASAFFDIGSQTRTTNQVLDPITYNPNDTSGGFDYTYIDSTENNGATPGRQFTGVDFTGNQYFTIPAVTSSVPEPASLGLLAVGGISLLSRRNRKA